MRVNTCLRTSQGISDFTTLIRTNLHQFSNCCILYIIRRVSYEKIVITPEHCGIPMKIHNTHNTQRKVKIYEFLFPWKI